jgi:hypothetical protein
VELIEEYKIQKVIARLNNYWIRDEFGNETTCYAKSTWNCKEKPIRVVIFTDDEGHFELAWTCGKHMICPISYWKEV